MSLRRIACVGEFSSVIIFDDELTEMSRIETADESPTNLKIVSIPSPEEQSLIAVTGLEPPYPLRVYDAIGGGGGKLLWQFRGHRTAPWGLASFGVNNSISPSSPLLLSAASDNEALAFDAISGEQRAQFNEGLSRITQCLHVNAAWPNRAYFGGCDPSELHVFDLAQQKRIGGGTGGHTSRLSGIASIASHNAVYSTSHDGTVRVWTKDGEPVNSTIALSSSGYSCCCCDDSNSLLLAVGLRSGHVEVFDVRQVAEPLCSVHVGYSYTYEVVHLSEKRFASGCYGGQLSVWDAEQGEVVSQYVRPHDRTFQKVLGVCTYLAKEDE